jgi:hypothetical protein
MADLDIEVAIEEHGRLKEEAFQVFERLRSFYKIDAQPHLKSVAEYIEEDQQIQKSKARKSHTLKRPFRRRYR